MASDRPPTLDPAAAARWHRIAPAVAPWLHEEVGRRMQERLEWIRLQPRSWADWEPMRGGQEAHRLVAQRYPQARCDVVETAAPRADAARALLPAWWRRWAGPSTQVVAAPAAPVDMLWANMLLHQSAAPQALIAAWHQALATDGFVMFSCLGPDTLRELRTLYAALGWPPPTHDFTDMHDWGDMLVHAGFAEPVMDMERITLTWEAPERLLAELRELGPNMHVGRFPGLRGRGWRAGLDEALQGLRDADGRLALTFEVIYGHALKPAPRMRVEGRSSISLQDMRELLHPPRRDTP